MKWPACDDHRRWEFVHRRNQELDMELILSDAFGFTANFGNDTGSDTNSSKFLVILPRMFSRETQSVELPKTGSIETADINDWKDDHSETEG